VAAPCSLAYPWRWSRLFHPETLGTPDRAAVGRVAVFRAQAPLPANVCSTGPGEHSARKRHHLLETSIHLGNDGTAADFPPSWVLKRELLWLPVIGQAIYALEPIAINRKAGHSAVKQVLEMGQARLKAGLWVAIMPEGTRMPPGTTRRYGLSGALLAQKTGRPIVPVAHNAGDFWKRNAFLKYPGTIQVRVGKPVYANGRPPVEVNAEIQNWIETQMKELSPGYQGTFQPKPGLR